MKMHTIQEAKHENLTDAELQEFLLVEAMVINTWLKQVERTSKQGEKIGLILIVIGLIGSIFSIAIM